MHLFYLSVSGSEFRSELVAVVYIHGPVTVDFEIRIGFSHSPRRRLNSLNLEWSMDE